MIFTNVVVCIFLHLIFILNFKLFALIINSNEFRFTEQKDKYLNTNKIQANNQLILKHLKNIVVASTTKVQTLPLIEIYP